MDNMGKNQEKVISFENEKNWIELGLRCLVKDLTDAFPPNVYIKPVLNICADKKTVEVHFVLQNPVYALAKLVFEYSSKKLLSFSLTTKNSCETDNLSEQQIVTEQQSKKEQPATALPKTTTDIVEEMIRIIEKCRDEVNGDIGDFTLYINRPGCMPKNAIEGLLTAINSKVPDLAIKRDNIAAIFIPNDSTWERGICIFDKGLYIAYGYTWLVVYWHDLISAKPLHGISAFHEPTPLYLNIKINNCLKRGEIRKAYEQFSEFLTSVANQIKEIDDWETMSSTDAVTNQMEHIVGKYKKIIEEKQINGTLYLRNRMPMMRLKYVLTMLNKLNDEATNINDVIALYQDNSLVQFGKSRRFLINLLITRKGFYYSTYYTNYGNDHFNHDFIYWNSISGAFKSYVIDEDDRIWIEKTDIKLRKKENEIAVNAFIVPMLNELRKVDEMV